MKFFEERIQIRGGANFRLVAVHSKVQTFSPDKVYSAVSCSAEHHQYCQLSLHGETHPVFVCSHLRFHKAYSQACTDVTEIFQINMLPIKEQGMILWSLMVAVICGIRGPGKGAN